MTYEQVKRASEAAYKAYSQHVPYGEGGNETAVKAGHEAWRRSLEADCAATIADLEAGTVRR